MFYRPEEDDHGLPHNPFKAIVSPRPIGWISTVDADGQANLAPYSFFNAVADAPPMVMFSSTGVKDDQSYGKDSIANIKATGEFVVNIVSLDLKDAMNASSAAAAASEDEFGLAGLEAAPCEIVGCPRVAEAPANLECKLWQIIDLPGASNIMAIGQVVGVHIRDEILVDGIFDVTRYRPLSRLGYKDYSAVAHVFSLNRPGQN